MRYISGLVAGKGNLLGRGSVTVSPAADVLFPVTNLYDGLPSKRFKFGSVSSDCKATDDLNEILNGGFETSTLASWTSQSSGTGSSAETTVGAEVHGGTKAMKLGGGASGVGSRTQDIVVRSGERRKIDMWMRGDGSKFARFTILNMTTLRYLKSDGTWTSTVTDLFTESGTTYINKPLQYQVESWTVCQASTVTLRLCAYVNENGFGYVDDIVDSAAWNFACAYGHNIPTGLVPELRSSTDNFSSSNTIEATLTPTFPAFYGCLSTPSYRRYARIQITGQAVTPPWYGELILGYAESAARSQKFGFPFSRLDPQLRSEGGEYAYLQSLGETQRVAIDIDALTEANMLEVVQDMWRRSRSGADTAIIVPTDGETRVVLGRFEAKQLDALRGEEDAGWQLSLALNGLPLPSIVT